MVFFDGTLVFFGHSIQLVYERMLVGGLNMFQLFLSSFVLIRCVSLISHLGLS